MDPYQDGTNDFCPITNLNSFEADGNTLNTSMALQEAIEKLSTEQPFISFNLRLTAQEISTLDQLEIASKQEYINYAELQNLSEDLTAFIKLLSTKNDHIATSIAQLINRLVNNVVFLNVQGNTAWVIVRASVKTDEFDLPDWHTDPCVMDNICKFNEHLILLSLKGSSTLFYTLPAENREEFNYKSDIENYIGNATYTPLIQPELQKRQELHKMLDSLNAVSTDVGQGYILLVGNEYGAVHTAPPIHKERLFIAIYPGLRGEIKQIEKKALEAREYEENEQVFDLK